MVGRRREGAGRRKRGNVSHGDCAGDIEVEGIAEVVVFRWPDVGLVAAGGSGTRGRRRCFGIDEGCTL